MIVKAINKDKVEFFGVFQLLYYQGNAQWCCSEL